MTPEQLVRFESKVHVEPNTGCHMWIAATTGAGYGAIKIDGRMALVHRLSYEHHVGVIPTGLQLDHLCRQRCCVNPEHLEPVTCQVNTLRGDAPSAANATKTHCPVGHEYTEENTQTGRGMRYCRACRRAAARARYPQAYQRRCERKAAQRCRS